MTTAGLPWRGPGPERPELPLPPGKVPIRRDGSWRKRWRYLGAFCDELLLCAARVQVGPVGQTFWAIWERDDGELHERTRTIVPGLARGEVWTQGHEGSDEGRIDWAPESGGTLVRIEAAAQARAASACARFLRAGEGELGRGGLPHRRGATTTSGPASASVAVECDVRIGERRIRTEARGVEDESCGYHPHHTVWDWSAGVGETPRRPRGRLEPGRRDQRPASRAPSARSGSTARRRRAGAGELRRARGDRRSTARGSSSPPRPSAASEEGRPFAYTYRQPFGTFTGHAARRARARLRARRDGAPRRRLVAAAAPSAAPIAGMTDATRQRHGGSSPGGEVVLVAPVEGLQRDQHRDLVVEQRRRGEPRDLPPACEPRDPLPAERGPVEPV